MKCRTIRGRPVKRGIRDEADGPLYEHTLYTPGGRAVGGLCNVHTPHCEADIHLTTSDGGSRSIARHEGVGRVRDKRILNPYVVMVSMGARVPVSMSPNPAESSRMSPEELEATVRAAGLHTTSGSIKQPVKGAGTSLAAAELVKYHNGSWHGALSYVDAPANPLPAVGRRTALIGLESRF